MFQLLPQFGTQTTEAQQVKQTIITGSTSRCNLSRATTTLKSSQLRSKQNKHAHTKTECSDLVTKTIESKIII
jgi:hypothetical protein